jgi:hypothetical protein
MWLYADSMGAACDALEPATAGTSTGRASPLRTGAKQSSLNFCCGRTATGGQRASSQRQHFPTTPSLATTLGPSKIDVLTGPGFEHKQFRTASAQARLLVRHAPPSAMSHRRASLGIATHHHPLHTRGNCCATATWSVPARASASRGIRDVKANIHAAARQRGAPKFALFASRSRARFVLCSRRLTRRLLLNYIIVLAISASASAQARLRCTSRRPVSSRPGMDRRGFSQPSQPYTNLASDIHVDCGPV